MALLSVMDPKNKGLRDFSDENDRRRLSATALKAFRKLADRWALSNPAAADLLGVSSSTWDRIKSGRKSDLSQDQLTRVSVLVGVFKGLHLLFADEMADRWLHLPNRGPLFENFSPIDVMRQGGIPRMLEVRQHVDAIRGGL